jgi:hypothetical protein
MTDHPATPGADAGLQFDTAETTAGSRPSLSCAACARPIQSVYHQANGKTVCSACRAQLEATGSGGFGKAALWGAGAGLVGWAIYFAILKITDYELALVAILVGWMVARAINAASGGRGGLRYQILG